MPRTTSPWVALSPRGKYAHASFTFFTPSRNCWYQPRLPPTQRLSITPRARVPARVSLALSRSRVSCSPRTNESYYLRWQPQAGTSRSSMRNCFTAGWYACALRWTWWLHSTLMASSPCTGDELVPPSLADGRHRSAVAYCTQELWHSGSLSMCISSEGERAVVTQLWQRQRPFKL